MKLKRTFGIALLVASMLMALTGTALATPLYTNPSGTDYTGPVHETLTGTWTLKGGVEASCTGATRVFDIDLNVTNTVQGQVTSTSFSGCAGTVDVLKTGSMWSESGALSGSGMEVTVTQLGVSCVYGTSTGTKLGTLVAGSSPETTESAMLPKISGGLLCATTATVNAQYKITSPTPLLEDR